MASKKITLSIPEKIFKELKREKDLFGYSNLQEVILDNLRDNFFKNKAEKETRGRPKKFDDVEFLTGKKPLFSKKGKGFEI